MTPLLTALLHTADAAAALIREVYAAPFAVDYKAAADPVTQADRRANELICQRLEQLYPGLPVVAEESPPERYADFRRAERVFFVDPLDGTREFVSRNGEFAVMIGLLVGDRAEAGVIVAPETGTAWCGELGAGAFLREAGGTVTPLHVSAITSLREARLVASRSHRSEHLERAISALGLQDVRQLGSAGLKGSAIAAGAADIYAAPGAAGQRWDLCAVDALVTAAGGRVSDAFGEPITYRGASLANDRGALLTNGRVHELVLERLHRLEAP